MKKWVKTGHMWCGAVLAAGTLAVQAQMPSLDDFMPPVANDPAQGVVAPTAPALTDQVQVTQEKVTAEGPAMPVVTAANAQDSVIVAKQKLLDQKQDAVMIKYPSGLGFMARGSASYMESQNRNVSLLSRREAYVTAYMKARANLARILHGLSNESEAQLVEVLDKYNDSNANQSLANKKAVSSETIAQKVEGMIRGYSTYAVEDNPAKKEVQVIIVTTPKTQGRTMRVSGGAVLANNAAEGIKQVYGELKAGIVPPVGGKVIEVPSDGGSTFFFIAFGSAIIPSHEDADLARELRIDAFEEAEMRAAASLCAIIVGDDMAWERGMTSQSEKSIKDFDWQKVQQDPTSGEAVNLPKPLGETRKSYVQTASKTSAYANAQRGQLPPGLSVQKWETEDGDWAFSAIVYNPEMTMMAADARDAMIKEPGILERGNAFSGQRWQTTGGAVVGKPVDPKKDAPIQQSPSGVVSQDEDL